MVVNEACLDSSGTSIEPRRAVMLGEAWRALARRHIVYDVPDEMAACFDCDVVRCPDDRYASCAKRLAFTGALQASPADNQLIQAAR